MPRSGDRVDGWFWWDRRRGTGLETSIGTRGSRTSWKPKQIVHQCREPCILRSSRGFGRQVTNDDVNGRVIG